MVSGKMKMMFPTLLETAESLKRILEDYSIIQTEVDAKDLVARFTTDVIGSCAFGIDCNSLENPTSEFRTYGDAISQRRGIKKILQFIPPRKLKKIYRNYSINFPNTKSFI